MNEANETLKIAYGDESVRVSSTPPLYLLAATVLADEGSHGLEALEKLVPKGAKKLHWRDMTNRLQSRSLAQISSMEQTTTIVVASPLDKIKQERARRKCLARLLVCLEETGVEKLVLESRKDELDKRDRDCLLYLRRSNAIWGIDIEHVPGDEDPRLWLPDQILGAYGDVLSESGHFKKWVDKWESMADDVEVIEIGL